MPTNNALTAQPSSSLASPSEVTTPTNTTVAPPPNQPVVPPPPPPGQKTIADIQRLDGWQWCTAKLNNKPCASGLGNATSSMEPNQANPSLSGGSSKFDIAGPTPYSNALWWRELGPDSKPTHFTYDLYFYLEDPTAPEALEFDVNHTVNGSRYVFGTECSYRHTGYWDVWDAKGNRWDTTSVACPVISAKTWHHLVWQFEQVNNKMHYISVTLDDQTMPVDKYYDPQQYGKEGISIAFQMDGDYRQTPYSVWLDNVNLVSW